MRKQHTIDIDIAKCKGCGLCQKDCPTNNIHLDNHKAAVITQSCIMCGHCVAICPFEAVSMTGFDEAPRPIQSPPVTVDSQQLLEALRTRRSIRQFTDRTVTTDILAKIIEAGRLTPTGGNTQATAFIVLKDNLKHCEAIAVKLFRRLLPLIRLVNPMAKRITIDDDFFFKKAPVAIVILAQDQVDGALAAADMALMAEACGLGVLYSGFFTTAVKQSRALRRTLGMSHGDKAIATLVLGYSQAVYHRMAPKEAADVRQR